MSESRVRLRRYIRIADEEKWEIIDRLATLEKYKKSFNKIINDALDYGLPMLEQVEFGEVESISANKEKDNIAELRYEIMTLKNSCEDTSNKLNLVKALLCSLFNAKMLELKGLPIRAVRFEKGFYQNVPESLEVYEYE